MNNLTDTRKLQERRVMIVPVGLEKARIMEGCTTYAVNVIYLIRSRFSGDIHRDQKIPGVSRYSLQFAKEVKENLEKSPYIIKEEQAELNSVEDSIQTLNKIYENEQRTGLLKKILINVSTASKAFAIAAYIFGLYHPKKTKIFYAKTQRYILLDHLEDDANKKLKIEFEKYGLTQGTYDIEEIPLVPVRGYNTQEKELLKYLADKEEFKSITDILNGFYGETAGEKDRIKLTRLLNSFERQKLIRQGKTGTRKTLKVLPRLKLLMKFIGSA